MGRVEWGDPNTFNLGSFLTEWQEDQGEEPSWRRPQGPVGAFAWVGVAAFGLSGVGPAEPAGVDHGGQDVQPCGRDVPG
jgi:hypothetical protein